MGRPPRTTLGGYVYHVRCTGLQTKGIFRNVSDYQDFLQVLSEASRRFDSRILGFCCLPSSWHLLVMPRKDDELSRLIAWITITHSARWHTKPRRATSGGLYERRFKSFPVQEDESFLEILQFMESHLILRLSGEDWPWSSAAMRTAKPNSIPGLSFLAIPPVAIPQDWSRQLRKQMPPDLVARIRNSIQRGCPYGKPNWVRSIASRMNLESTLRPRGRPATKSE